MAGPFLQIVLTGYLLISSRLIPGSKNLTHHHYASLLQPSQTLTIKRSHGSQEQKQSQALRGSVLSVFTPLPSLRPIAGTQQQIVCVCIHTHLHCVLFYNLQSAYFTISLNSYNNLIRNCYHPRFTQRGQVACSSSHSRTWT